MVHGGWNGLKERGKALKFLTVNGDCFGYSP